MSGQQNDAGGLSNAKVPPVPDELPYRLDRGFDRLLGLEMTEVGDGVMCGKVAVRDEIKQAAGAQTVWRTEPRRNRGGVHLLGTCRMGNDPATSVIDKYHRTHDVPNLFLCDGSSFVTSGRGQPTMTIQALAFRAADHIGQFAKRNEI